MLAEIEAETLGTPIYYADETGIDTFLYREYGRAPRGVKIYADTKGKKFKRKSIVAAKCGSDIAAPLMYDGTMDSRLFLYWFEHCLCAEIKKGSIVIIDNATVHSKTALFAIAERLGVRLIFQPAYSPDLNKIEKFWAWLKNKLRKILTHYATLEDAICAAFDIYVKNACHSFNV
ncbi:MAG: transposase [Leptospirales bacterium]|nr:transposase [Leptospirales bacterium]